MVLQALNSFDQFHGTSYFDEVDVSHITMHEDRVRGAAFEAMDLPPCRS